MLLLQEPYVLQIRNVLHKIASATYSAAAARVLRCHMDKLASRQISAPLTHNVRSDGNRIKRLFH